MSSRQTIMSENTPLLSADEAPANIGCSQKKHQLLLFCIMISIILGVTSLLFKENRNGSMSLRNNSKMYSNGLTTESNKSEVIDSIPPTQATKESSTNTTDLARDERRFDGPQGRGATNATCLSILGCDPSTHTTPQPTLPDPRKASQWFGMPYSSTSGP